MPYSLYVCLQDEDKIVGFAIDAGTGQLTRQAETSVVGGPSVLAISADRQVLYAGHRTQPALSSFRIDPETGGLTLLATVPQADAPTFLAPDRTGRYMLIAYYQGGYAAVHPIGADGAVGGPAVDRQETANGAHAIATDPSNRFAFVPRIARLNDNVLEPPKNNPGPNFQFAVPDRAERTSRAPPLLLSSDAGLRLFLQRAGLQRHRLSARPRERCPLGGADDLNAAGRIQRPQHLLADPSDVVGSVSLCRQPRPQQHRRLRRRSRQRAIDRRRACAD